MDMNNDDLHAFFFHGDIIQMGIGNIFSEIFKNGIYSPFFAGKTDQVVIDAGAHVGIATYFFSLFSKKIYSLEPCATHFDALKRMVEFNKGMSDIVVPINKALYIKEEKKPLYHCQNETMHSLNHAVQDIGGEGMEMVQCTTIDKIFEEYNIEHVDFLKLDVEGAEIEIISNSAFKKVAPKIDKLISELHVWNGRHPHQMIDALKNAGFSKVRYEGGADKATGKSDALIFFAEK